MAYSLSSFFGCFPSLSFSLVLRTLAVDVGCHVSNLVVVIGCDDRGAPSSCHDDNDGAASVMNSSQSNHRAPEGKGRFVSSAADDDSDSDDDDSDAFEDPPDDPDARPHTPDHGDDIATTDDDDTGNHDVKNNPPPVQPPRRTTIKRTIGGRGRNPVPGSTADAASSSIRPSAHDVVANVPVVGSRTSRPQRDIASSTTTPPATATASSAPHQQPAHDIEMQDINAPRSESGRKSATISHHRDSSAREFESDFDAETTMDLDAISTSRLPPSRAPLPFQTKSTPMLKPDNGNNLDDCDDDDDDDVDDDGDGKSKKPTMANPTTTKSRSGTGIQVRASQGSSPGTLRPIDDGDCDDDDDETDDEL